MKRILGIVVMALMAVVFTAVDVEAQSVEKKRGELSTRTMDGAQALSPRF